MTWTYTGDPSDSDKDAVRFIIGDTNTGDQLLSDEEIAWLLTENGGKYAAAVAACEAIAAAFSRKIDLTSASEGSLSLSYADRRKYYLEMAATIRRKNSITSVIPYAGGIRISDKSTNETDTDRPDPDFYREMDDYVTDQNDPNGDDD